MRLALSLSLSCLSHAGVSYLQTHCFRTNGSTGPASHSRHGPAPRSGPTRACRPHRREAGGGESPATAGWYCRFTCRPGIRCAFQCVDRPAPASAAAAAGGWPKLAHVAQPRGCWHRPPGPKVSDRTFGPAEARLGLPRRPRPPSGCPQPPSGGAGAGGRAVAENTAWPARATGAGGQPVV